MEASVLRRDTILTRGELAQKSPGVQTQGKIQKEMGHTQRKIKETGQVRKIINFKHQNRLTSILKSNLITSDLI